MLNNNFKFIFFGFIITVVLSSCGSLHDDSSFENVLYPNGRPVTIKISDENIDRRFDFYFLEANRLKMLGDYGNAALYFTEALKFDSTCATCYYEIGNLLIQNNEVDNAESFMFKAVQFAPDNEYFVYLLSKLYANNNKLDLALQSAEYLCKIYPENLEYLLHLSQLHALNSDFDNAISVLNRVETLMGINENISIEKQSLYTEKGDFKGAEREFQNLIDAYPNNPEYYVYLGDFYTQQKNFKKAYILYNKVVDNFPSYGKVYFSLANYYYLNSNIDSFKSFLYKGFSHSNVGLDIKIQKLLPFLVNIEQEGNPLSIDDINSYLSILISLHPSDASVYVLNGNFQKYLGNDSLALVSYETSLLIDEQQENIWQEYLMLLFTEHTSSKLLTQSRRVIDLYPENGMFNYFMAFAYMMNDFNVEAIEYFNKSLDYNSDNVEIQSQIYGLLGDLYFTLDSVDQSFKCYDKSLELRSNNVVVLNNYAYYLSILGRDLQKAEQMISNVIQLEPGNPTYLDTYAWVLFQRGKYLEALFIIEQAIENGGDYMGVVLEHYGDILYKIGNTKDAIKYWKLAAESDDDVSSVLDLKISSKTYISEKN